MNAGTRELTTRAALLLMETFWAYAVVALVVAITVGGDRPTLLGVALLVFASFGISRALQGGTMSIGFLRFWGVLLSVLVFYAILRIDFFGDWRLWNFGWADRLFNDTTAAMQGHSDIIIAAPLLWLLWLRGVMRGQQYVMFESVVGSFAIGVVVVALVEAFAGKVDAPAALSIVAVPYVAVGLLAIALAHAARADQAKRELSLSWLGLAAGAVAAVALIALLLAISDISVVSSFLAPPAKFVGGGVARLLYYVLYPIIVVMTWFFEGLRYLWSQLYGSSPSLQNFQQQVTVTTTPTPAATAGSTPGWVSWALRALVGIPAVAALLAGTALLFSRMNRRAAPDEVKESTYQEGRLSADLGGMLKDLLGRFRPGQRGETLEPAHRLYFDLLRAAAQRSVERRPPETPLELAPRLDATFAGDAPSRITAVFDDARYGGLEPPAGSVEALRREWEQSRKG